MKFLLVLIAILLPTQAFACECEERSVAEYYADADVVLVGKYTKILKEKRGIIQHEFIIDSFYKKTEGVIDGQEKMSVQTEPDNCGGTFEAGEKYVVFGKGAWMARYVSVPVTAVNTHICDGTVLLSSDAGKAAHAYLKKLEKKQDLNVKGTKNDE